MDLDHLIPDQYIPFEEALLKDPKNETLWLDYVQTAEGNTQRCEFILERAVQSLPTSHNLWNLYLHLHGTDGDPEGVVSLYQRALIFLYNTPALWLRYIELLKLKNDIKQYTRALDLALFNLHASHHQEIWQLYLDLAEKERGELGVRILSQIFEMQGSKDCPLVVDRCELVLKIAQFGDLPSALKLFQDIPRAVIKNAEADSSFIGIFLDILIGSSHSTTGSLFELIASDAALDMPHNESKYLLKIATFYDKKSNSQKAQHFYNASIYLAISLKALARAFEAYTNFLDRNIKALDPKSQHEELELNLDFFENVLENQPVLANDILLKSEPNNVDLWLDRMNGYKEKGATNDVIATLIEAIKTINPLESTSRHGKSLTDIWAEYASLYTSQGDDATAKVIFLRAVKSQYKSVDDLATIYILWCELALSSSDEEALAIVEEVLFVTPSNADEIQVNDRKFTVQERVFKSSQLWAFYLDLLNSMGDSNVLKDKLDAAYNKMMSLHVITLRLLFQHADFLIEKGEFQRSCSVFEAGIAAFESPTPRQRIWKEYLTKLVKYERDSAKVVDVFEACITSKLPGHLASEIFTFYAKYLEDQGSLTRSVTISQQGLRYLTQAFSYRRNTAENCIKIIDDKYQLYKKLFSDARFKLKDSSLSRTIMTEGVQDTQLALPMIIELTIQFAQFEEMSNEFTRSRALYKHAGALAHPDNKVMAPIWTQWMQFEVNHGTEQSYKEMMKFKRTVKQEYEEMDDFKSEINPMGFVKSALEQISVPLAETKDPNAIDLDMDM